MNRLPTRPLIISRRSIVLQLLCLLVSSMIVTTLLWLFSLLPLAQPVSAQSLPTVRWACSSRTIYIGDPYSDPALAAYPSQPNAPKQTITLPQLETIVAGKCGVNYVENLGAGIWLLRSNIVVSPTAQLLISDLTANEVRLESITVGTSKQYVRLAAIGGHILIQGASPQQRLRLHSWNTPSGQVDSGVEKGRSFIVALNGGRLDIHNAEMSYLGWYDPNPNFSSGIGKGEPSGLAWKRRATENRPETGPTGSIIDSLIHHNYYGNYTWQATNMILRGNKVYDNWYYGFDPHDYSYNFVVEDNEFYNNGKHGLIFSRGCVNNIIRNNRMYNNKGHGLMLDRGTNNNTVENNEMFGNYEDGIVLYESSNNVFRNNNVHDNKRHGLRINATYDSDDIYDGLAIDNQFLNNQIINNARYGISLYERADRNSFSGNLITGNGEYGFYLRTGLNNLAGNTVSSNRKEGIYVVGGPFPSTQSGTTPYTPPLSAPGRKNIIENNTINNNLYNGIFLKTETLSTTVQGNTILGNSKSGVAVDGSKSKFNRITRNSISNNIGVGIRLANSGNASMSVPRITSFTGGVASGTAAANAQVELFCDTSNEGLTFRGVVTANSSGNWSLPVVCATGESAITATATDSNGNTSAFGAPLVFAASSAQTEQEMVDQGIEEADLVEQQMAQDALEAADDMLSPADEGDYNSLADLAGATIDGQYPAGQAQTFWRFYLPIVNK